MRRTFLSVDKINSMKKYLLAIIGLLIATAGVASAAPAANILRNILPESSGTYEIGSSSPAALWLRIYTQNASTTNLTVSALNAENCDVKSSTTGVFSCGTDATGGSGGSSDFNYVVGAEGRYLTPTSTVVGLLTPFTASSTLQRLSSIFSTSTNATSTNLFSNFAVLSTSTIGNLLTGTVTATSTTASSSFKDLFWVDGQATSLSLSGGLTALGALSGSNLSGTNTGDVTLAGTPNYLTLSGQQITLTKLDISDDTNATAGVGLTLTANDFACDTATSGAFGCLTSADWTTFNSKQATISATWPVILTGATLSFGGLSTSTAAVIGNIPYFSGANTFANVATGTVSGSGGINVTAGRSAIGGALAISADCATITGGAGLCDGVDDTSAGGGAFAWTPTTWGGVQANSTSTLLLLNAGAVISTSSIGQLTVGTLTATSTTASTTLDDFSFVQGQGTGLSLSGGLSVAGASTLAGGLTLTCTSCITDTNVSNTLTASDLVAGSSVVANSEVDDDITLTNITQITNRAITDLTGTLTVGNGGTGGTAFSSGGWLFGNGASALGASSSPTVGWITATSTATSTLNKFLFTQGQGTGLSLTNLTVTGTCTGCGTGSQTPWTSNIDGAGFNLIGVGTASTSLLTVSGLGNTGTECLQINNQGVVDNSGAGCGGGTAVATIADSEDIWDITPQTDSTWFAPGGAFVDVLGENLLGVQQLESTSSAIYLRWHIPDRIASTSEATLYRIFTATTTGNCACDLYATTTDPTSGNYASFSWTLLEAGSTTPFTVTGNTSYRGNTTTTPINLTLTAGQDLVFKLTRIGADADDTLGNGLFLIKAYMRFAAKSN